MIIARQMDVRANIKKYFDIAYHGEAVVVPRKQDRNVVIISEAEYRLLEQLKRASAYNDLLTDGIGKKGKISVSAKENVKARNKEKLSVIKNLKDDWNGNGAPAFSDELIAKISDLIDELMIQPEIFPTALGTIQLEYDNSGHDHMEIEIGLQDEAEIFIVNYNGKESFENITVSAAAINDRIKDFYG